LEYVAFILRSSSLRAEYLGTWLDFEDWMEILFETGGIDWSSELDHANGDAHTCPYCKENVANVLQQTGDDMIILLSYQPCHVFEKNNTN